MNKPSHLFRRQAALLLPILALLRSSAGMLADPILPVADPLPSAGSLGGFLPGPSAVSAQGAITAPPPEPDAPGVTTAIEGPNFDNNAAVNGGSLFIPPDPIGAAGPSHVVAVVNCGIRWNTKAGVQQNNQSLQAFFGALTPVNATFDPKVIYDSQAGRFVVVTLERRDTARGDAVNSSRILVAVSDDSDPNGTWYFLSINSLINISGADRWADYPGLGVDEEAIYITNNMFGFGSGAYAGTRLWIINKTPLYTGGAGAFTVHDPFAGGGGATTAQPAQIVGTPPSGATGTWLVSYSGLSDGTDEYLQFVRVDNPVTAPAFSVQQRNIGNIDNFAVPYNNASQLGSAQLINTNDRRAINAVWRNNRIYTAATTLPPGGTNAGQVTARFWEMNATNVAAITLSQSGEIGGEDIAAGAYTFFPSIAANAAGDICVGFSASAATIYPGAYAVVRLSGDALGTVRPALTVAAGTDYYYRAFGGTRNRWGDYSGTVVDPANDSDFWVFNEYAMTRGTVLGSLPAEDGRWATRWAKIDVAAQAPTLAAPATGSTSSNSVAVNFTLPETAQAGSVTLTFSGPATRTLTLAASQETSGPHSFTFNPANPTGAAQVASIAGGATIPDGIYTVTLSYNDTLANGPATAASSNVTIDTTPPTLSLPANITVTATSPAGATVNYTASASDPGGSGIASSSFVPASGSTFIIGTTTVNATATDHAGNVANGSFTVTVNPNPAPTGGSFTITPNAGVHQGDSLSLSTTGWSDPDLPLTYQFFIGTTSLNSPGTASTLNISAPASGSYTLKVRVTDAAGSFVEATQPLTVVPFTSVETWRQVHFGDYHNSGNGADNADPDFDGEPNRIEFAFGTNPTSGVSGPQSLRYTGTFAGGGTVTFAGQPTMMSEPPQSGVDLRALFVRRVDYVAAGLTYIVEFSADLSTWIASAVTPTVLADDGTVQIVSVPAPAFLNVEKRKIVRVRVVSPP